MSVGLDGKVSVYLECGCGWLEKGDGDRIHTIENVS